VESLSEFGQVISNFSYGQIGFLILAALTIILGQQLIKKKYLNRNGIEEDEQLDDRNSWILLPKQYNTLEKTLLISVYVFSFIFIVIAVNQ